MTKYGFIFACLLSFVVKAVPVQEYLSRVSKPIVAEKGLPYYVPPGCKSDDECNGHGTCDVYLKSCACEKGYALLDCSYHQKKQITGFVLHTVFGYLGAGQLYIGNYVKAGVQALFGTLGVVSLVHGVQMKRDRLLKLAYSIIGTSLLFCDLLFWVDDLHHFLSNNYLDNQGQGLEPW